jgi:outer membrane lipoprotein-sorting protein
MKNKFLSNILIIITTIASLTCLGQESINDQQKCKDILQKVSNSIQKNNATKFSFKLEVNSEDFNEVQNGYALIKQNKFFYKTEEREVTSDGKNVWTYILEDNECYIDLITDLENTINPSEIFSIWQNGFKFKYVNNKKLGTDLIHIINMYPENPKESKYHTLIMEVNESKKTINQASIKTKDGVTIKIYVSSLVNNPEIKQDQFIWNTANYTDVDLIDNR